MNRSGALKVKDTKVKDQKEEDALGTVRSAELSKALNQALNH